jgi:hypothetical protein
VSKVFERFHESLSILFLTWIPRLVQASAMKNWLPGTISCRVCAIGDERRRYVHESDRARVELAPVT